MTFRVVRVISSWYFVSYVSYHHDMTCRTCFSPLVCRRWVLPFEHQMDHRDTFLVSFVLLWLNVRVFNASGHQVNDGKIMNKLTYHTVISRSVARIGILKSLLGVLRVRIGWRGPVRQGSVIPSPWGSILRSKQRPFVVGAYASSGLCRCGWCACLLLVLAWLQTRLVWYQPVWTWVW